MQKEDIKTLVKKHWDNEPCGTRNIAYPEGTYEYYEAISANRYRIENWIYEFAGFDQWGGKKILEVGCGTGSDLIEFAKNGAIATGIDLSTKSVELAKRRLSIYNLSADVLEGDAERMPFEDDTFDMVYSIGVLHHTPDAQKAIREIHRVAKPGGEVRVVLYHRYSVVSLQCWLRFALFRLMPFISIDEVMANHIESIGTRVYTKEQVKRMFGMFKDVSIKTLATLYDIRYAQDKYLPRCFLRLIPNRFGWYLLIKGKKVNV